MVGADAVPDINRGRSWAAGARLRRSYFLGAVTTVLKADRAGAILAFGLQFVGAFSALALILAGQFALTAILDGDVRPSQLITALTLLAVATSLSSAAGALQALQQRVLGERVAQYIWRDLLSTCARVDLLAYESSEFTHRLDRVRANAVSRPLSVVTASLGLTGSAISVVVIAIPVLTFEPLLLLLLLAAGAPVVLIARRLSVAEFNFTHRTGVLNLKRFYVRMLLSQRVSAAEIRAFDAGPAFISRSAQHDAEYLANLIEHVRHRRRLTLLSLLASAIGLAAALGLIVVLLETDRLTIPEAGAAVIATRLLGGQLASAFRSFGSLIESGPFLQEVREFFERYRPGDSRGSKRSLEQEIRLDQVAFSYPGQAGAAISDVSLTLPRGSVLALVGENGCGKTTLAKVIAGLFGPTAGTVLWDGERMPREDLRASCSVLFQDYLRYLMSVADNVSISDTSRPPDRERVREQIERVGLSSAVDALPLGMDTMLGRELDDGTDLSGGQWQRLALARALYRDADLLVLDEPSAALDPRAEYELFQDVRRILGGRSAILISHRYSSVRLADHIVVMHGGRVVERGNHASLMAAGGRYAEFFTLQAESFAPPVIRGGDVDSSGPTGSFYGNVR